MHRKIITLCMTLLLLISFSLTAFAQDFDPVKTGTVTVTLTEPDDKEPIADTSLSIYCVATARMNPNGNLGYVYTDDFKNSGIELNDSSLAIKLDAYVSEHSVTSVKITTDESGKAICKDLISGLYFIKQTDTTADVAVCSPFIVTMPNVNDEGYVYEVNASPKTETKKLTSITIKKVWNTALSAGAADYVTVQLLKNDYVVKTATLNAQNNWQVTYEDMPESDAYSIKEIDVPKGFTATYSRDGYVFTVTNTSTLIQTGQLIWPIPVLALGGILLIVVGFVLLQKKRKRNA